MVWSGRAGGVGGGEERLRCEVVGRRVGRCEAGERWQAVKRLVLAARTDEAYADVKSIAMCKVSERKARTELHVLQEPW